MTRKTARTVANVIVASACAAAAYAVFSKPAVRRVAVRVLRVWLGASVPGYLAAQVVRAWLESGHRA
jgi:hypothetical protein